MTTEVTNRKTDDYYSEMFKLKGVLVYDSHLTETTAIEMGNGKVRNEYRVVIGLTEEQAKKVEQEFEKAQMETFGRIDPAIESLVMENGEPETIKAPYVIELGTIYKQDKPPIEKEFKDNDRADVIVNVRTFRGVRYNGVCFNLAKIFRAETQRRRGTLLERRRFRRTNENLVREDEQKDEEDR